MRRQIYLLVIVCTAMIIPFRGSVYAQSGGSAGGARFYPIEASNKWNNVGDNTLSKGESYRFEVKGCWQDASIQADATEVYQRFASFHMDGALASRTRV